MIYFENGTAVAQKQSRYFTDALDVLMEHNESSSEDMFEWIQDPEMIKMVTRQEYMRITGAKRSPKGSGRSLGGRTPKPNRERSRGDHILEEPLLPQQFDWAGIIPIWER